MLIDVRTKDEFEEGHAEGAIHLPLDQIIANDLGPIENVPKDQTLYLYCRSGSRSGMACEFLRVKGYMCENVGGLVQVQQRQAEGKQY